MDKQDFSPLAFLNPKNLSVRALLIQAAVWVVLGNAAVLFAFVVAGLFQDSALHANQRAVEIQRGIDTVSAEVYKLSALEERLLRLKALELGDMHAGLINQAQQDLMALRTEAAAAPGILDAAEQISSALNDYSAKMKRLVVLQREVGISQDTGITGELGAVSASVEYDTNAVNDKRLLMFHKRLQGSERGYSQSKNPDFLIAFQKAHQRFSKAIEGAQIDPEKKAAIASKLPLYLETMERLVERDQALLQALASMQSTAARIPKLVEEVHRLAEAQSVAAAADLAKVRSLATWIVVGLSLGVMALLSFGAYWLQRRISPPLNQAVERCEAFAAGDLSARMQQESRGDEIGALQNALVDMSARLRSVVAEVRAGAHVIFQGASEISAANEHLSSRTEESAASLEETASSMEQMNSTVKQTANNAARASELADNTRDKAESGGVVVEQAVSAMEDISSASHRVESVIGVVNEIAFQTNLLALNAAVEAARAGDAGRGFAVVASEVRNLAQRSAESAQEVRKLIGESAAAVESGQELVNQSGKFLSEIIQEMHSVTRLISEIKNATQEQSDGIDQVNQAVLEMDQVTQQNAAMVEQAAAASKAMEDKAQELAQLVGYFKVEEAGQLPQLSAH